MQKCTCGYFGLVRLCSFCAEREFQKLPIEKEDKENEEGRESLEMIQENLPEKSIDNRRAGCYKTRINFPELDLPPPRAKFTSSRLSANGKHYGFDGLRIEYLNRLNLQYSKISSWKCPKCGLLDPRNPPLAGEGNKFHCSSLDCDREVEFESPKDEMILVRTSEKAYKSATILIKKF